jgi:hypothetical protein
MCDKKTPGQTSCLESTKVAPDSRLPWRSWSGRCRSLGGHLKTGHRWTLQNRPTELNQNKSIYTLETVTWAIIFSRMRPAGLY